MHLWRPNADATDRWRVDDVVGLAVRYDGTVVHALRHGTPGGEALERAGYAFRVILAVPEGCLHPVYGVAGADVRAAVEAADTDYPVGMFAFQHEIVRPLTTSVEQ